MFGDAVFFSTVGFTDGRPAQLQWYAMIGSRWAWDHDQVAETAGIGPLGVIAPGSVTIIDRIDYDPYRHIVDFVKGKFCHHLAVDRIKCLGRPWICPLILNFRGLIELVDEIDHNFPLFR